MTPGYSPRMVAAMCLVAATAIFVAAFCLSPGPRVTLTEAPTATPTLQVIVVTATVTPREAIVPLPRAPTPRGGSLIQQGGDTLPMGSPQPTATVTPTATETPAPEPPSTRVPQTPVQKG